MLVIGLTGENCAGKSTVADHLAKKGFYFLSLSDILREELKAEGRALTRDNLINKGNELRAKFGAGILAKKTIAKMEKAKDRNYAVDSIRNPAEVAELKKLPNFFMLYVTASPEVRFDRIKHRDREEDPKTFEAFIEIEKLEMENAEKTKQNLKATFALANKKIENAGSLPLLYEQVDAALGAFSAEFKLERPTWDAYFMNIAKMVSTRSNCVKRKVAAVIVRDKQIISTGYNGTPRGTRNCNEGGCPRCNNFAESGKNLEECFCSHGEENAIVQAAYNGVSIKGASIYTTFSPCLLCTKMIINAGIVEVIYNEKYPIAESAMKLLKEAGVKIRQFRMD
ncbi:AAA family ATPase [Candidatus Micrarchaeota archaeon]|nr:AAA family ATPase [Candidatus Micrarchaeota archaeon]